MKAKEREMKKEKENEKQVSELSLPLIKAKNAGDLLIRSVRNKSSVSKTAEQRRKRKSGMRRWQKKCMQSGWRG